MINSKTQRFLMTAAVSASLVAGLSGCSNLPGNTKQQGAAIGGVSGAAAGALLGGGHHRLLGALLGGAVGAGGGYLIGANSDKITGHESSAAQEAVKHAQAHPATPDEARQAGTADLNRDGFVTMDEVVAMRQAGFQDQDILARMQATGQVFELSPDQQNYLRSNGVDQYVIDQIPNLNRDTRDRVLSENGARALPPSAYPPPTGGSAYPPAPVYPPSTGWSVPAPPPGQTPVPPPPAR